MHPNTVAVQSALEEAGATGQCRQLDASTRTAADAAAALDCEVGAIANSLVFMADETPILVLASGAHRVDTGHLADAIGVQHMRRATPEEVREATEQPIGGVSPVAHPHPLSTFLDVTLEHHPVVWAAAGTPNAVFPTTYAELHRICNARPVTVAAS